MAKKRLYAFLPDGTRVTRVTEADYKFIAIATEDGKTWQVRRWSATERNAQAQVNDDSRVPAFKDVRIVNVVGSMLPLRDPRPRR